MRTVLRTLISRMRRQFIQRNANCINSTFCDLRCSTNGASISSYEVLSNRGGIRKTPASKRSLVLKKVKPGKYRFRIRARNAVGAGPWTSVTATVKAPRKRQSTTR